MELAVCPVGERVLLVYNKASDEMYSRKFYLLLLDCFKVWGESFGATNPRFVHASETMRRQGRYPDELRYYHKLNIALVRPFDRVESDLKASRSFFLAELFGGKQGSAAAAEAFRLYTINYKKMATLERLYGYFTVENPVSAKIAFDRKFHGEMWRQMEAVQGGRASFKQLREMVRIEELFQQEEEGVTSLIGAETSPPRSRWLPRSHFKLGEEVIPLRKNASCDPSVEKGKLVFTRMLTQNAEEFKTSLEKVTKSSSINLLMKENAAPYSLARKPTVSKKLLLTPDNLSKAPTNSSSILSRGLSSFFSKSAREMSFNK